MGVDQRRYLCKGNDEMKEKKYAICDDCGKPIKNIFDIYDYVDLELIEHTVCGKCIKRWIDTIGHEKAKKLVIKKRKFLSEERNADLNII